MLRIPNGAVLSYSKERGVEGKISSSDQHYAVAEGVSTSRPEGL
jgi:hypothetical protein